jgi:DNA-binding NtrC family response regulator
LLGASGSGKELAARALHALSDRRRRPLVARNAATIPESLVDAELFGNTKNYPNPGMADRPGLIGEANGSVLFLDEIAEIPAAMQAHLLRVLDGGEYHRLGESAARRSDMRLIAATSRRPGDLKHDLLARFTYRIEVPDLNARREDVPLLIAFLLQRLGESDPALKEALDAPGGEDLRGISLGLCAQLVERVYIGNLRELERLLLQAFVESGGAPLGSIEGVTELAETPTSPGETVPPPPMASESDELRPERIQAVLDQHNGRIEAASKALGLKNRFVLGRLIAKYGLEVRRRRS